MAWHNFVMITFLRPLPIPTVRAPIHGIKHSTNSSARCRHPHSPKNSFDKTSRIFSYTWCTNASSSMSSVLWSSRSSRSSFPAPGSAADVGLCVSRLLQPGDSPKYDKQERVEDWLIRCRKRPRSMFHFRAGVFPVYKPCINHILLCARTKLCLLWDVIKTRRFDGGNFCGTKNPSGEPSDTGCKDARLVSANDSFPLPSLDIALLRPHQNSEHKSCVSHFSQPLPISLNVINYSVPSALPGESINTWLTLLNRKEPI